MASLHSYAQPYALLRYERMPVRKSVFTVLSVGLTLAVYLGASEIPFLGSRWTHVLHEYALPAILLISALGIAILGYAMGLWQARGTSRVYALIVCIVIPPVVGIARFIHAMLFLHPRLL